MSGITLAQAQSNLDALLAASANNELMVRFGDRSVTYRSAKDITDQIAFWNRMVIQLTRTAAGGTRHGYSVADFGKRV